MSGTPPPPTADQITVTPIPGLTATNVQEALAELQANKQPNLPTPPSARNAGSNPNVPAITQPLATPEANTRVLLQVRQGMQSLAGQIGSSLDRAVTFQDLINLGLLSR